MFTRTISNRMEGRLQIGTWFVSGCVRVKVTRVPVFFLGGRSLSESFFVFAVWGCSKKRTCDAMLRGDLWVFTSSALWREPVLTPSSTLPTSCGKFSCSPNSRPSARKRALAARSAFPTLATSPSSRRPL